MRTRAEMVVSEHRAHRAIFGALVARLSVQHRVRPPSLRRGLRSTPGMTDRIVIICLFSGDIAAQTAGVPCHGAVLSGSELSFTKEEPMGARLEPLRGIRLVVGLDSFPHFIGSQGAVFIIPSIARSIR